MQIGWPQGIFLLCVVINLVFAAVKHGQKTTTKNDFFQAVVYSGIALGILWWGGFFDG